METSNLNYWLLLSRRLEKTSKSLIRLLSKTWGSCDWKKTAEEALFYVKKGTRYLFKTPIKHKKLIFLGEI